MQSPLTPHTEQTLVVASGQRLSECMLWEMQRDYFDREGINAWVKQVPFYVVSNPYIATAYAEIIAGFIHDYLGLHPDAIQHPFYIMELGTGSGQFSFYVQKFLQQCLTHNQFKAIKICYVMTDFTQNNIKYWESHPALKTFLKQGTLDFAIYDLEQDHELKLQHQNKILTATDIVNPLIVCANYIFDTVSHDAFAVKFGELYESKVRLTTEANNVANGKPIDWQKLHVDYQREATTADQYYDDAAFNAVLASYQSRLRNGNFLLPIAALRCIRKLMKLANNRLFLISSDKGYSHVEEYENLNTPKITFHGSFSLMVNMDAIAQYFRTRGGNAFMQTPRSGLDSAVYYLGMDLADFPETSAAIDQYLERLSPADYFLYHRHMSDHFSNVELPMLLSHLKLTNYDPYMFSRLHRRIIDLLGQADSASLKHLLAILPRVAENYYYMPSGADTLFEVALVYHNLKDYDNAIHYYQASEDYFGQHFNLYYNIGLCLYYLRRPEEALVYFQRALLLKSDSREAQEWLDYIENEKRAQK